MEITEIAPETRKAHTLPWEETIVMPIGDVQLGAQGVEEERLKRHLEWGMEQGAYFLGMGDYVDVMSPSNREAWRSIRRYDSVTQAMQEKAQEHVERFLKLTKGTEERWLGLLHGHHFYDFEDGTTSDTRIAQALKAPYLGTCGAVILRFERHSSSKKSPSLRCVIWAHHGWGSARRQSGPINNLEDVAGWFEADIYLMGHQTKKPAVPKPRLYVSDAPPYRLVARKKILAGTGGFYQGYVIGSKVNGLPHGTYVEEAGLPPVALGGIVLKIRPVHSGSERGDRIDMSVEL